MPKNPLGSLPFPPLKVLDQDVPVKEDQVQAFIRERGETNGVSMLLRSENGHPNRGGYFFHFVKSSDLEKSYDLHDFQKRKVASMDEEDLVLLINHCSGRQFSEDSYHICQNQINLRDDFQ